MIWNQVLYKTIAGVLLATSAQAIGPINLSLSVPENASEPILPSFVSFSIEFSSFPDFAGNLSSPNNFSYNLIKNLGVLHSNPIIRVGGNSQDYTLFNSTQQEALIRRTSVNRTIISIGSSFFESYSTWPNVSYIHGFNLGNNDTAGVDTLYATVPLVCKALNGSKLAYFQLGNEPDLYKSNSSQGPIRPSSWNETNYVQEWVNKSEIIHQLVQKHCPEVIQAGKFSFYSPSFGGVSGSLKMVTTWQQGLGKNNDVAFVDSHNYISGAQVPGVTLQGTLMNHTSTVLSVNKHLNESRYLKPYTNLSYILGETNSLYDGGRPGLSNLFGASLWVVDFSLYNAATNIKRIHMHQGTGSPYGSWQAVNTSSVPKGTKPPYYGNIMVAAMLGNVTSGDVRISDLELGDAQNSAYAAYVGGQLRRVALIQMTAYNYTNTTGSRPSQVFNFTLPSNSRISNITVQRLLANGSDALSGITFDGYSYNYELMNGNPVLLSNVTRGEVVQIGSDGTFSLKLPYSSAAILNFQTNESTQVVTSPAMSLVTSPHPWLLQLFIIFCMNL